MGSRRRQASPGSHYIQVPVRLKEEGRKWGLSHSSDNSSLSPEQAGVLHSCSVETQILHTGSFVCPIPLKCPLDHTSAVPSAKEMDQQPLNDVVYQRQLFLSGRITDEFPSFWSFVKKEDNVPPHPVLMLLDARC